MTPETFNWIIRSITLFAVAAQLIFLCLWRKRWKEINSARADLREQWDRFWTFHATATKTYMAALGLRDELTVVRLKDKEPYVMPRENQERLVRAVTEFDKLYDDLGNQAEK